MMVNLAVPEDDGDAGEIILIPRTGYEMLESFVVVCVPNVGWSVQLPLAGAYPAANTSSNVYCTVYVIDPVTTTLRAMFAGEI
jgi:hypothetical protein